MWWVESIDSCRFIQLFFGCRLRFVCCGWSQCSIATALTWPDFWNCHPLNQSNLIPPHPPSVQAPNDPAPTLLLQQTALWDAILNSPVSNPSTLWQWKPIPPSLPPIAPLRPFPQHQQIHPLGPLDRFFQSRLLHPLIEYVFNGSVKLSMHRYCSQPRVHWFANTDAAEFGIIDCLLFLSTLFLFHVLIKSYWRLLSIKLL